MHTQPVALFIEAWRQMTERLPSPRYANDKGVASCFSNVPNLFFNLWVQSQPATSAEEFRALLATAAQRAETSAFPVAELLGSIGHQRAGKRSLNRLDWRRWCL